MCWQPADIVEGAGIYDKTCIAACAASPTICSGHHVHHPVSLKLQKARKWRHQELWQMKCWLLRYLADAYLCDVIHCGITESPEQRGHLIMKVGYRTNISKTDW